jgi:excinuclease ABC subunit C
MAVASDLGLHELSLVGLAKERETVHGEKLVDRVYLPGQKNALSLKPNSPELFLLARIRDEAHRFSNSLRKRAGKKRGLASSLDSIAGIGPKTRKALQRAFSSLAALKEATDEQLLAVKGVTRRQVDSLRASLKAQP